MPDFDAVCTAVAARFAPGTMTPPAGVAAVRASLIDLPGSADVLPCVMTSTAEGTFEVPPRQGKHRLVVQLLYSQGLDPKRDVAAIRKYLGVMVDQLRGATQLGGSVAAARVAGYRSPAKIAYGGEEFFGLELDVDVITVESWSPTA